MCKHLLFYMIVKHVLVYRLTFIVLVFGYICLTLITRELDFSWLYYKTLLTCSGFHVINRTHGIQPCVRMLLHTFAHTERKFK